MALVVESEGAAVPYRSSTGPETGLPNSRRSLKIVLYEEQDWPVESVTA